MNVACDYEAPMQMLTTEKYSSRALYTQLECTAHKNVIEWLEYAWIGVT